MKKLNTVRILLLATLMALSGSVVAFAEGAGEGHNLGELLPVWSVLPFVGMLLSIAIFPLVKAEWWEHNELKVVIFWSAVFLIPFGINFGGNTLVFSLLEILLLDYLPFIVLLFGLFVVAGGIILRGTLIGTPKVNLVLLLIGTLLASWVGTTGASMLMIRPVIRANQWRQKKAHVIIFFIFLISNIGGCLTPVGDPPLFLGFLRGVPFFWTMRLFPIFVFNAVILLAVLFLLDSYYYKKELAAGRRPEDLSGDVPKEPLKIGGAQNLIFMAMIVGAVILSGLLPNSPVFADQATGTLYGLQVYEGVVVSYNSLIQMAIILIAAFLSLKITPKTVREDNCFTYASIKEVATLFIGIFITMMPALAILKARGTELGLADPYQFFWASGALSSFLDNAPTYLVFMTTAASLGAAEGLATSVGVIAPGILLAVSAGAVFMGANTYIGNAPNFMVRCIAEENKVVMPSFFGYMGWSICFLIPLFIIDTLIFFL
ncbi:MAG TPA: sodium:proton antiporter [Anaerovoracaceae bacterium]|nr:sodium:proton antiporter [Anaerovoracaceae bacterium]